MRRMMNKMSRSPLSHSQLHLPIIPPEEKINKTKLQQLKILIKRKIDLNSIEKKIRLLIKNSIEMEKVIMMTILTPLDLMVQS